MLLNNNMLHDYKVIELRYDGTGRKVAKLLGRTD